MRGALKTAGFGCAILFTTVLALLPGTSSAADTYTDLMQARLAATKELVAQSKEVCESIPLSGYRSETEQKLEAQAKLNSVLSKLADIGASGAIKADRTTFENVAQDKLAELLKDRGNCRANFVTTMSASILAPLPAPDKANQ